MKKTNKAKDNGIKAPSKRVANPSKSKSNTFDPFAVLNNTIASVASVKKSLDKMEQEQKDDRVSAVSSSVKKLLDTMTQVREDVLNNPALSNSKLVKRAKGKKVSKG